ncbi:TRAP transporter small permease [Clostridium transplantifaecale]|uniref:TRAP transporter small permease n=1 Tax=Clostridium transplantifaecale TaxID=2479838 RepID=UPI000F63042A|nr:TRAP transporter small permease [Clostridium transplantifaecale]
MLKKIDEHLEDILLVTLLSLMSLIIFVQVIMRYLMHNSLSWSEELARYLFIWSIYLSVSYAAKERKHIKIDAALYLFPKKCRPFIRIIGDIIVLCFAGFIIATSFRLVQKIGMLGQVSAALSIPMNYIYMAPLIGFVLTFYRTAQNIRLRIVNLRKGVEMDD